MRIRKEALKTIGLLGIPVPIHSQELWTGSAPEVQRQGGGEKDPAVGLPGVASFQGP